MINSGIDDSKLIDYLISQLAEIKEYIIKENTKKGADESRGNYFYAFNPAVKEDWDSYSHNIRLISVIYDVLNEFGISRKRLGYTYIKDAVCIIIDIKSFDVCLNNEIYPVIAKKYRIKDKSRIEHDIRNCIDAAYYSSLNQGEDQHFWKSGFTSRPTNKTFILHIAQEVSKRMLEELNR